MRNHRVKYTCKCNNVTENKQKEMTSEKHWNFQKDHLLSSKLGNMTETQQFQRCEHRVSHYHIKIIPPCFILHKSNNAVRQASANMIEHWHTRCYIKMNEMREMATSIPQEHSLIAFTNVSKSRSTKLKQSHGMSMLNFVTLSNQRRDKAGDRRLGPHIA